jgi:Ca2+-binding RTX toxin-like protein
MNGGAGNDTMSGGSGADRFVFDTKLSSADNRDRITDFSSVPDQIHLDNAIFKGLAAGLLISARFWKSSTGAAHDADDRIIYNTTTGALIYDSNGNAAGGAVSFAILTNKAHISASDFFVI